MNTDYNYTDYKTILQKDGVLAQPTKGCSMLPLLRQNRDTVVVKPVTETLKVNDVVFYKRANGEYVLHRIVKITPNGYVIRGDNCYYDETDIKDDNILGILSGYYRDEEYVDCQNSKQYKNYVFRRRASYPFRLTAYKLRTLLSKIKRKIIK